MITFFDTVSAEQVAKNAKAVADYCSTLTDPTTHNLCAVGAAGAAGGDGFAAVLIAIVLYIVWSVVKALGAGATTYLGSEGD